MQELSKERNKTMSEVLRQSIINNQYLSEQLKKGSKILIEDKNKNVREIINL